MMKSADLIAIFMSRALAFGVALNALLPAMATAQRPQQEPFGVEARYHEEYESMLVTDVTRGSLADKHGIKKGDVIEGGLDARGREIWVEDDGVEGFARLVEQDQFTLFVYRKGVAEEEPMKIKVRRGAEKPASRPRRETEPHKGYQGSDPKGPAPRQQPGFEGVTGPFFSKATRAKTRRKSTLVLEKFKISDPGFQNMHSHTMLVPKGWRAQATVKCKIGRTATFNVVGRIVSPDGRSIAFGQNENFVYGSPMMVEKMRQQGSEVAPPPQRPGDVAVKFFMPRLRPGARNVRVVETTRIPGIEQLIRQQMGPMLRTLAQNGIRQSIIAEMDLVRYELGGQQWEEVFVYAMTLGSMPGLMGQGPTSFWSIMNPNAYRAPAGQLVAEFDTLTTIARTIRPTPQWSICSQQLARQVSQMSHETAMMTIREMGKRAQIIRNANNQISEQQMIGWKRQQESNARQGRAAINSILDVHEYRSADGFTIAIDHKWDRVYQDALGNTIMTNDPSYDPRQDSSLKHQDWTQLPRADRIR